MLWMTAANIYYTGIWVFFFLFFLSFIFWSIMVLMALGLFYPPSSRLVSTFLFIPLFFFLFFFLLIFVSILSLLDMDRPEMLDFMFLG